MSEKVEKFPKTATGQWRRWSSEMLAADKRIKSWHKQGFRIQARFQDRRGSASHAYEGEDGSELYRVNLFHANVKTLRDMLYGNPPKVEVSRRFNDADDDVARVAGEMLNRILNSSIEASGDDTKSCLGYVLEDRLLPGLGIARVRYEFDEENEDVDPIYGEDGVERAPGYSRTSITDERAIVEYVHWDDFRWGWARTWSEVPWIAFRSYQTREEVKKRFGENVAKALQYKNKSIPSVSEKRLTSDEVTDAHDRAEIWEIWDKSARCVYWWSQGYEKVIEKQEDPLGLFGFWPCPEPMLANTTTSLLLPQPDFALAQDLYNEIDQLETRIGIITSAVKVVGVYDETAEGVQRMLQEGFENQLIPVKNWAAFAEGKGLDGKVQWMPVEAITEALDKLVQMRSDAMALLYEVTGMAEIIRGGNGPDRETAEASRGKRQFASVRVQSLQEEFARFASDLMCLRAEVISRHFEPQTIIKCANMEYSFDKELIGPATQLIKTPKEAYWRIKVEPESMAMIDYNSLKADRAEYIEGLSQFLTAAFPLAQAEPGAVGPILQLLKWSMAGFKGSSEVEGVLDKAIDQLMRAGQQQKQKEPSPEEIKAQSAREKAQADKELQALKHQHAMELEQAKLAGALQELKQELVKELAVIREEMRLAIMEQTAEAQAAMEQDDHETANQIKVDDNKGRIAARNGSDSGS